MLAVHHQGGGGEMRNCTTGGGVFRIVPGQRWTYFFTNKRQAQAYLDCGTRYSNNNNNRLMAFVPGQPG